MKKYNNKGISLFITLALLLLISVGIAVFLITSYNYANINESISRRLRALTLAEAGINYAYWKIRIDEDGGVSPIVYPITLTPPISSSLPTEWSIQVDIVEDAGRKTIRSTVGYPKATVFD